MRPSHTSGVDPVSNSQKRGYAKSAVVTGAPKNIQADVPLECESAPNTGIATNSMAEAMSRAVEALSQSMWTFCVAYTSMNVLST